jgi:hypothetical protein
MRVAKKQKLGCLAQRRVQPWRCPSQKRVRGAEVIFSAAADFILYDCARVVIHTVSNLCPHYPFVTTPLPHDASLDDIADAMEAGNEELPYSVQSSRDLVFGDEHRRHDFEAYNTHTVQRNESSEARSAFLKRKRNLNQAAGCDGDDSDEEGEAE